jgi:dihydroflavonol-4-reductase
MNCFITGATGFIGANLLHELSARGNHVRILVRPGADLRGLKGLEFETVRGDLSNRSTLAKAMRGCEWCFHLAASYHLWLRDYRSMYAANVEGTRNAIEAAMDAGVSRIIYTSTVGCIGLPEASNGCIRATDEATPVSEAEMTNPYKLSKWKAERIAMDLAAKGAPVIIVNPSAPVGPRDARPTPTGGIILDFLNGRMPAYVDTGLNWVHVRDVAVGHILAAQKGQRGQRYILGNEQGNWTMKQALDVLAAITGFPAPTVRLPHWLALGAAHMNELASRISGKPPRVPLAGVRMAKDKMFFSSAKAIRELGLPQTPPKEALADAVEWFRRNGYVKSR